MSEKQPQSPEVKKEAKKKEYTLRVGKKAFAVDTDGTFRDDFKIVSYDETMVVIGREKKIAGQKNLHTLKILRDEFIKLQDKNKSLLPIQVEKNKRAAARYLADHMREGVTYEYTPQIGNNPLLITTTGELTRDYTIKKFDTKTGRVILVKTMPSGEPSEASMSINDFEAMQEDIWWRAKDLEEARQTVEQREQGKMAQAYAENVKAWEEVTEEDRRQAQERKKAQEPQYEIFEAEELKKKPLFAAFKEKFSKLMGKKKSELPPQAETAQKSRAKKFAMVAAAFVAGGVATAALKEFVFKDKEPAAIPQPTQPEAYDGLTDEERDRLSRFRMPEVPISEETAEEVEEEVATAQQPTIETELPSRDAVEQRLNTALQELTAEGESYTAKHELMPSGNGYLVTVSRADDLAHPEQFIVRAGLPTLEAQLRSVINTLRHPGREEMKLESVPVSEDVRAYFTEYGMSVHGNTIDLAGDQDIILTAVKGIEFSRAGNILTIEITNTDGTRERYRVTDGKGVEAMQ